MRAVARLIGSLGVSVAPVAPVCLQALAGMLLEAAKNPKCPGFNHQLFEAAAALVRHGAAADPANLGRFEATLFPAFDAVLQQDVQVRRCLGFCFWCGVSV
jgi:exportin-2 (importin alpha re-exporter)